jgi:hypothetical protein
MRFSYYERLSAKEKRIYRKSDELRAVPIPSAEELAPLVRALDEALVAGKRVRVAGAAEALCAALFAQLGAPPAKVRVRVVRPHVDGGELHGLYTFAKKNQLPVIEVWMRTAAHAKVVRFRTFLRTLVHEIGHHLDVTVLGLEESFHTAGFFARESSLVHQLLPKSTRPKKGAPKASARRGPSAEDRGARQLGLFEE